MTQRAPTLGLQNLKLLADGRYGKGETFAQYVDPIDPPIRLWARLGVDLFLTEEQYDAIINADVDYDVAEKTFINVIKAGLFEPCGDSYIPSEDGGIDIGNFNI